MVAITVSCTMIRIRGGTLFLKREITTLETAMTTTTESASTMEGFSFTVTASAEQIPSTCTVIGLLCPSGSLRSFRFFDENKGSFSVFIS